jgi:hypothetical protein
LQQLAPGMLAFEDTQPTPASSSRHSTGGVQQPAQPFWTLGVPLAAVEEALGSMAATAVRTHGGELSDLAAAVQALPDAEGCTVQVCWTPAGSPLLLPVALPLSSSRSDGSHQSSDRIEGQEAPGPHGVVFCLAASGGFTQSLPKQPLSTLRMQQLLLECCGWRVVWVSLEAWQQTQQVPAAGRPRKRWQLLVECLREAGLWDTRTGRVVV